MVWYGMVWYGIYLDCLGCLGCFVSRRRSATLHYTTLHYPTLCCYEYEYESKYEYGDERYRIVEWLVAFFGGAGAGAGPFADADKWGRKSGWRDEWASMYGKGKEQLGFLGSRSGSGIGNSAGMGWQGEDESIWKER